MKKAYLLLIALTASTASFSQTEKGNWLLEVGTSAFSENLVKQGSSTGFSLFSTDGTTIFSLGAEGGYFDRDDTVDLLVSIS